MPFLTFDTSNKRHFRTGGFVNDWEDNENHAKHGNLSTMQRYLAFSLHHQEYGIPLLKVLEVIGLGDVTPIPNSPSYFLGIMNLRGLVISIIDLRLKLTMPKAERTQETAVIILNIQGGHIGVVVDSVDSVLSLSTDQLSAPPQSETQKTEFITNVARLEKRFLLILDIEKTLSAQDLSTLKAYINNNQTQKAA